MTEIDQMMTASKIAYCSFKPDGSAGTGGGITGPMVLDDDGRLLDERGAGLEVDRLAREEAQAAGSTYGEALATVARDPGLEPLVRLYTASSPLAKAQQRDARAEAGAQLDRRVKRFAIDNAVTYTAAFQAVLADPANAELKRNYALGAPAKQPIGAKE